MNITDNHSRHGLLNFGVFTHLIRKQHIFTLLELIDYFQRRLDGEKESNLWREYMLSRYDFKVMCTSVQCLATLLTSCYGMLRSFNCEQCP